MNKHTHERMPNGGNRDQEEEAEEKTKVRLEVAELRQRKNERLQFSLLKTTNSTSGQVEETRIQRKHNV